MWAIHNFYRNIMKRILVGTTTKWKQCKKAIKIYHEQLSWQMDESNEPSHKCEQPKLSESKGKRENNSLDPWILPPTRKINSWKEATSVKEKENELHKTTTHVIHAPYTANLNPYDSCTEPLTYGLKPKRTTHTHALPHVISTIKPTTMHLFNLTATTSRIYSSNNQRIMKEERPRTNKFQTKKKRRKVNFPYLVLQHSTNIFLPASTFTFHGSSSIPSRFLFFLPFKNLKLGVLSSTQT